MPTERLMGMENEFAFTAQNRAGGVAERVGLLDSIDEIAERLFVSLPCLSGSGIFLENGARLYLDCGAHLEFCTPECSQPWDVVRYLRAGEKILLRLSGEMVRRHKHLRSAMFYRCNVDYTGSGCTWGTHESFLFHQRDPRKTPADMIPHLVSRLIFTGAGGFYPLSINGACTPVLSPRAFHFKVAVSSDSTRDRPIFHTKNESLTGGYFSRMHVIVGEALCSDLGNWLKVATTGLVVAMSEAGLDPGNEVALADPVEALHAFASDVTARTAQARTTGGGRVTALEIQRHYLALAQVNLHADWMPAWAPRAIEQWDAILRRIEEGPDAVATSLDWAIKRHVFAAHLRKREFTWEKLEHWSHLTGLLANALSANRPPMSVSVLSSWFVRQPNGPLREMVQQLDSYLQSRGLWWDELDEYLKLRIELFELDTRFGMLGDAGIFNLLDKAGALAHAVEGVDQIEDAVTNPPASGRAKFRSAAIRQCVSRRHEFGCDWDCIHHFETDRYLDLCDPWTEHADWSQHPQPAPEKAVGLHRYVLLREARRRSRPLRADDIQF